MFEASRVTLELAARRLADDPNDALALWAGAYAARRAGPASEALEGGRERFKELFQALPMDDLPAPIRRPLLGHRGGLARLDRAPFRPYFQRQGCVQDWLPGAEEGHQGPLELARVDGRPFRARPEEQDLVVPLACVVRIWSRSEDDGVRRLATRLDHPGGELWLELAAGDPMRVWIDGALVYRTDRPDRYPVDDRLLAVDLPKGAHDLVVGVAQEDESAWIMVRATDAGGDPVPASAQAPRQRDRPAKLRARVVEPPWAARDGPLGATPYQRVLGDALALEHALAFGDSDRAEELAGALRRMGPHFAEGWWLIARMERDDPSRGRSVSIARERKALDRALELDATLDRARLRKLGIQLGRDQIDEVREVLADLPADRLDSLEGLMFRWQVYRQVGDDIRAQEALDRAMRSFPSDCDVLTAQLTLAREVQDVAREDRLVRALTRCPGSLSLQARHASRRGDRDRADALWAELLARSADDPTALVARASLARARGDLESAISWWQKLLSRAPFRFGVHLQVADALAALGQPDRARERVEELLARYPFVPALRSAAEAVGRTDPLLAWRADGHRAFMEYLTRKERPEGVSEVLVFDRTVARAYPDGTVRTLIHEVVHLTSKEALDRYGEMSIPEGAELLTLRSIKPDGSTREPESIAGKDGLSLRGLEVGDGVEYEYIRTEVPKRRLGGHMDVAGFRFQSPQIPYVYSELVVLSPPTLPLRVERRRDPPARKERVEGGLRVWTWTARDMPRLGVEPNARAQMDEVPSVRVYTDVSLTDWLDTVVAGMSQARRTNPELRRLARRLTRKAGSDRARLRILWGWVMEHVEQSGNLASSPTATLAARRGNRMVLLRAMLREVGVRAEIWVARNRFGPRHIPGGHPRLEDFGIPVLVVHPKGAARPVPAILESRVVPLGYLPPALAHAPALRLHLDGSDGPPGKVELPSVPAELQDQRRYELDWTLDLRGDGDLVGRIELRGQEAIVWREALEKIEPSRRRDVFEQAELARFGRGLSLEDLKIRGRKDLSQPLVLEFSAKVEGFGVRQGGTLTVPANLVTFNMARPYATLPERRTGLLIPYAPRQVATIRLKVKGGEVRAAPEPADVRDAHGGFRRAVQVAPGGDALVLELVGDLKVGIVEPEDYGDLVELAQDIDEAERAKIVIAPRGAGG